VFSSRALRLFVEARGAHLQLAELVTETTAFGVDVLELPPQIVHVATCLHARLVDLPQTGAQLARLLVDDGLLLVQH